MNILISGLQKFDKNTKKFTPDNEGITIQCSPEEFELLKDGLGWTVDGEIKEDPKVHKLYNEMKKFNFDL